MGTVREPTAGAIYRYAGCEVVELNVQRDHVHVVLMIPPKISVSELMDRLKGQTSMRIFNQFQQLRKKAYGNHFGADLKGYWVGMMGLDAEMIRKNVRYQEKKEKQLEHLQFC